MRTAAREKRVVVPEGMLNAFMDAFEQNGNGFKEGMEAALRWWKENPSVPSEKEYAELHKKWHYDQPGQNSDAIEFQRMCRAWQSRMFDAPEPEVPEEIKDLIHVGAKGVDLESDYNVAIIEAYRRGQQSAGK